MPNRITRRSSPVNLLALPLHSTLVYILVGERGRLPASPRKVPMTPSILDWTEDGFNLSAVERLLAERGFEVASNDESLPLSDAARHALSTR